jgi:hypothetical protein
VKVAVKLGNMETAAVQIANAVNQIQWVVAPMMDGAVAKMAGREQRVWINAHLIGTDLAVDPDVPARMEEHAMDSMEHAGRYFYILYYILYYFSLYTNINLIQVSFSIYWCSLWATMSDQYN